MFQSKKLNLLISFVIAIILWAYVIGEINPVTTKSFVDVNINLENQIALEERGLAIESISEDKINVTVKGERSRVQNVEKDDVYAEVDLALARAGHNELDVNVRTPEKVNVDKKSINKVRLTVGELVSEERPTKVVYVGATNSDLEPYTIERTPEKVIIRGAMSNVEKVSQVVAKVRVDQIKDKETTAEAELVPVDKNGKVVNWIRLSSSQIQVKAVMTKTKKVDLDVPIQGNDSGDVKLDYQKTVIIKGNADVVKEISKIETEPVDLSAYDQNTTIELKPILPKGVQLAAGSDMTAKVVFSSTETKNITFDGGEIDIIGLAGNLKATVEDGVVISAEGRKSSLNDVNKEDFTLAVDVSGYSKGSYKVDVVVVNKKEFKKYTVRPSKVTVLIE
ncbi:MAG: YbbR-like domain-containing protein [Christensenellales bacterium]